MKININFFVGIVVFYIFHLTIIFSRKMIFSKIIAKNKFWGCMTFFEGKGHSDAKSEYNFFYRKWGAEYCFSCFLKKPHRWVILREVTNFNIKKHDHTKCFFCSIFKHKWLKTCPWMYFRNLVQVTCDRGGGEVWKFSEPRR